MEYVLSLSYGKDSLACLGACELLGWKIDRIIHAEVWATDTIPADLPPMMEFKKKADAIIKDRWGIEVEHFRADVTYEDCFYRKPQGTTRDDLPKRPIYGFPFQKGAWCNSRLKIAAIQKTKKSAVGACHYLGIAADETERIERHKADPNLKLPLVEAGWTEKMCLDWCEKNDLLSPVYKSSARGGCWFCHNQGPEQLRLLRKNHPELWALLLKWDKDTFTTFKPDGHTVHDYDRRFQMEDEGLIPTDLTFRWDMLRNPPKFVAIKGEQISMWEGCL